MTYFCPICKRKGLMSPLRKLHRPAEYLQCDGRSGCGTMFRLTTYDPPQLVKLGIDRRDEEFFAAD